MSVATKQLHEVLEADARRRAAGTPAETTTREAITHSQELRFQLVNTFPRQTRPVFDKVRASLAPYGYTLSPLHPLHDLTYPRMQAQLARLLPDDPTHYAPLVFELDSAADSLRVYVRQFGGRAAPDFPERRLGIGGAADLPAVEAVLTDYAICMVEAQRLAATA
jgi:hypothetical protein